MIDPRTLPDPLTIEPLVSPPDVDVVLPGSKSITNRALVCAALAEGHSVLRGALSPTTRERCSACSMASASRPAPMRRPPPSRSTGVAVTCRAPRRTSMPTSRGRPPALRCRSRARRGAGRRRRSPADAGSPHGRPVRALRSMGVTITELGEPDRLPARITGPIDGAETSLPGDTSSQFITGLLLAGGASSMQVALTTEPISRPYIEMTGAVMRRSAQRSTTTVIDGGGWRRLRRHRLRGSRMPLLRRTFWPQLRSPEVGFVSTGSGEMHSRAMLRSPRCSGRWVAVSTLAPTMSRCPGERVRGRGRSERYLRHRADACRGGGVRRVTHPGRRHRLHP